MDFHKSLLILKCSEFIWYFSQWQAF